MDTMLYKYYKNNLQAIYSEKIELNHKSYNFYEISEFLKLKNLDTDKLRIICTSNYKIYNVLIKPFISMPTSVYNYKKKLLSRYFGLLYKFNKDKFIEDFDLALKRTMLKNSRLNFNSYCLSRMYEFDLDAVMLILGASRSGKSILFLQHVRRIYAFRLDTDLKNADKQILEDKILDTQVMYDLVQKEIFNSRWINSKPSIFCFDDAYTEGLDNRRAMSEPNLFLSHILNNKADKKHITVINMQQGKDLDNRYTDKSNSLIAIKKRSMARLYAKRKDMPFIKTGYGFNTFEKKPYLLNSSISANHNLNRMSAFIAKCRWRDMNTQTGTNNYCALYSIYLNNKYKYEVSTDKTVKPVIQPKTIIDINDIAAIEAKYGNY